MCVCDHQVLPKVPAAPRSIQAAVAMATAQRAHHPAQALLLQELHLEGQDQRHGGLPRQVPTTPPPPPHCPHHTYSLHNTPMFHLPCWVGPHLFYTALCGWRGLCLRLCLTCCSRCRNLDLSRFCIGQKDDMQQAPVYDLYAVINHYGGMIGGHYTAYARLPSDKNSQRSDVGEHPQLSQSTTNEYILEVQ